MTLFTYKAQFSSLYVWQCCILSFVKFKVVLHGNIVQYVSPLPLYVMSYSGKAQDVDWVPFLTLELKY